jgi:hypothetical protein
MSKPGLLSVAVIAAAMLATPALARENHVRSRRTPTQMPLSVWVPMTGARAIATGTAICVVNPAATRIAICGATWAATTGPWFTRPDRFGARDHAAAISLGAVLIS